MILRLLPEAEDELRDAAQWYEQRLTGLGNQFVDAVEAALIQIEEHPHRFGHLPYFVHATREIRRFLLNRFPYLIVYEVRSDELLVLAVAHAKRRPNYWRNRLP